MDRILLECEYFPCIAWFSRFMEGKEVWIEQEENFVRASLRNRCYIAGPHGRVCLSVPLEGGRNQKIKMKDMKVSYHDRWQHVHWQTILSNYGRSPYFQFFGMELEPFFQKKYHFLMDLNLASLDFLMRVTRCKKEINRTIHFHPYEEHDSRLLIRSNNFSELSTKITYHQVFEEHHGFLSNLSMLDFIFCENDLRVMQ